MVTNWYTGHSNQKILEQVADLNLTEKQYQEHVEKIRKVSRDEGIDYILDKYDADIIIGPADSGLSSHASGSGKNSVYRYRIMLLILF